MQKFSLLWIDDHINNYGAFVKALNDREIKIFRASTINEAIKNISKNRIDLILLDLKLAGETGFDFLSRVKERTNIPVCILSSYLHLEEYQKRISRIRKHVAVLDKSLPDPKSDAFDVFVENITYIAENPPKYTPYQRNSILRSNFLSKNPFEITFKEYLNLPSKVKREIREQARKQALQTINAEFKKGKKWLLLCADPGRPVKSLDANEEVPSSETVTSIAMDLDRVPFQFSAPDQIDDLMSGGCAGPSDLNRYPTVTMQFGEQKLDLHFDTGSPWTFASFEEFNELEVLSPNLIETDGSRGLEKYEYFHDTIPVVLVDQKNKNKKHAYLEIRAVKDWGKSPFKIRCPKTCENFGEICTHRKGLIGRNLIFENDLEITICGVTNRSSFRKVNRKKY